MVYGLFRALLGDRALLPPSLADRSANLTPASGRQDHTALPSAAGALRLCAPPTSIASCTNVRDDREAPLFSGQDAGISAVDLPDGTSEIFFARGLDSEIVKQPVGQISSVIRRISSGAMVCLIAFTVRSNQSRYLGSGGSSCRFPGRLSSGQSPKRLACLKNCEQRDFSRARCA